MKTFELVIDVITPASAQVQANSLEEAKEIIKNTDKWADTIVLGEEPLVEIIDIQEQEINVEDLY